MVNDLLGAGADVNNGVSYEDMSALHMACVVRSTNIMLTLLSHGASIGVRDENGKSPLHYAAHTCVSLDPGTDRVDVLLRAGADETARDSDGLPPCEVRANKLLRRNAWRCARSCNHSPRARSCGQGVASPGHGFVVSFFFGEEGEAARAAD